MGIAQNRPADMANHGAMPLDQGRERHLGTLAVACQKTMEQLGIGQTPHRTDVEQRLKVPEDRARQTLAQGTHSPALVGTVIRIVARGGPIYPAAADR
jgi:hypothetical protein